MTRAERISLAAIVLFFAAGYALYGLYRHWHFGSSAYDLGIFDQVVWHLSRFETPSSTIRGFTHVLGDHFSPILALFVPLYWIAPGPETLIVAQASLFALSIVPVFLYMRSRLAFGPAITLAIAYGCFWGLQRAAAFDVHEVAFAPLAIATAILAMDRRWWKTFWVAAIALILIKEDLIPLLGGFGVFLLIQGELKRAVLLISTSVVAFVAVTGFIIPAFNEAGTFGYTSAYSGIIEQPWRIPVALVTPVTKVRTLLLWFAPFAFLSLFSPLCVLVAPLAVIRFLSESPNHWGTVFHYSAPLAPILAMSAADGLSRLAHRLAQKRGDHQSRRFVRALAATSLLLSAFLPGRQPLWRVFGPDHYRDNSEIRMGNAVVRMVPTNASVVGQAAIVPHLSQRHTIWVLDGNPHDADYVIAAPNLSPWPASTPDELRVWLERQRARGYITVVEQDGWILLRRRSP
jgi:uncharacterized membrane protein